MQNIQADGKSFDLLEIDDIDYDENGEYLATVRLKDRNYRPPAKPTTLVVAVKFARSSWFVFLRTPQGDKLVHEFKPLESLIGTGLSFPNPKFLAEALVEEISRLNYGKVRVIWE